MKNYLDEKGINLIRANVGDRYVLEKMKQHGLNLGGEQSGHIILLDYNTTGDGLLTALQLVQAVKKSEKTIEELVSGITQWPQRLINVKVAKEKKEHWKENKAVVDFIKLKEEEMAGAGRVLVRTSGTEPLVRVMVEGKEDNTVNKVAEEIALVVEKELS